MTFLFWAFIWWLSAAITLTICCKIAQGKVKVNDLLLIVFTSIFGPIILLYFFWGMFSGWADKSGFWEKDLF